MDTPIKAVIIDIDDTLCLTEGVCFDLENEALSLLGRPPQSREIHQSTWGKPLYEIISVRSPGVDVPMFRQIMEDLIPQWVLAGKLDVIPSANFEALDALIEQGKELYILTSRTHKEVEHMMAQDHQLATRIKAFYYRDVMKFHKPDPRAFDELLAGSGLERSQCLYIGDSPSDAAAAKQAGMHFIASLESGIRTEEDFAAFPVDRFIHRFADLAEATHQLETHGRPALDRGLVR